MPESLVFTYGNKSLSIAVRPGNTLGDCLGRFLQVLLSIDISCPRAFTAPQAIWILQITQYDSIPCHFDSKIHPVFSGTTQFILSSWNGNGLNTETAPIAITVPESLVPMGMHRAGLHAFPLHVQSLCVFELFIP